MQRPGMKLICVVCLLMLAACASTKEFVKNPQRLKTVQRVAVIPFAGNNAEMGYAVAESLSANLVNSRFTVVERTQLDKLLAEQGLSLKGVLQDEKSIVGRLKGIDAIIVGSSTTSNGYAGLMHGGYRDYVSSCTARMIDVATGEILSAVTYETSRPRNQHGFVTPADVGEMLAQKFIHSDEPNH
ncbi:MAG TPA: CsgG/HfaB family protein [Nitrospirota bacterium]|nr:CsgG/HfaB family protein [Nitrospirota bacterium]